MGVFEWVRLKTNLYLNHSFIIPNDSGTESALHKYKWIEMTLLMETFTHIAF